MNTENKSSVLVIKDRGTGKSTQLVYTSAVTQYPIICTTQNLNYAFDGFGK